MTVEDRVAYRKLASSAPKQRQELVIWFALRQLTVSKCHPIFQAVQMTAIASWNVLSGVAYQPQLLAEHHRGFSLSNFLVGRSRDTGNQDRRGNNHHVCCNRRDESPTAAAPCVLYGCMVCANPAGIASSDMMRTAIMSYNPWSLANHPNTGLKDKKRLLAEMVQCAGIIEQEGMQASITYPMILDVSARLASMLGDDDFAKQQSAKAEMFYGMREWYTSLKNFVKWVFEPEETMADRLHWAITHFEEFKEKLDADRW
ncbi:hypothetical protein R3P38DRAFT_1513994 [Favolaschia claudopus]|uniref:Uncharacterized protein n=1 Tax=Favolaschia claudopus TaxID=2862362 RepID=A0AAW0AIW0_9AGAR